MIIDSNLVNWLLVNKHIPETERQQIQELINSFKTTKANDARTRNKSIQGTNRTESI
jgi:hypothetical protein